VPLLVLLNMHGHNRTAHRLIIREINFDEKIRSRVVVRMGIVAHQPAKPAAHRRESRVLRAERERLPVAREQIQPPNQDGIGRLTEPGSGQASAGFGIEPT
jgi:hypothetical protein